MLIQFRLMVIIATLFRVEAQNLLRNQIAYLNPNYQFEQHGDDQPKLILEVSPIYRNNSNETFITPTIVYLPNSGLDPFQKKTTGVIRVSSTSKSLSPSLAPMTTATPTTRAPDSYLVIGGPDRVHGNERNNTTTSAETEPELEPKPRIDLKHKQPASIPKNIPFRAFANSASHQITRVPLRPSILMVIYLCFSFNV